MAILEQINVYTLVESAISDKEIQAVFATLLNEYFSHNSLPVSVKNKTDLIQVVVDPEKERKIVLDFLTYGCGCAHNCQKLFSLNEIIDARAKFRKLSTNEKNCFILALLNSFSHHSEFANSSRSSTLRQRQRFDYRINSDRPVCLKLFLMYYGETLDRIKRLKKSLLEVGIEPPVHKNKGATPIHACTVSDREAVKSFITNLAENQGMPDPGRDVRRGKGRLRILLPSVMSYLSIHHLYEKNITMLEQKAVGYRTFIRIWQEELPHIAFNNPKTDLCLTCENFKKKLTQIAAILNEEKEEKQARIYQEALDHLHHAKKERLYYKAHAKVAHENYKKIVKCGEEISHKANSKKIMMHYSWDFAQQFHYPFEDQQVGPIYFKTPRRAQLFGICCEGIPQQVNYLIDESDFLGKDANTVISLLDHFFANHGMGEAEVYLSADNCVGQNKNNALIQYLMYRVLTGLHRKIEMSFLVVGHTKFSPDGFFGLIRQRYRRSQVYTYEQLAKVIEECSVNGHTICQRYHDSINQASEIIYRDWTKWLSLYFKPIPNITKYHHFQMDQQERGEIALKETVDSKEVKINLIKSTFPYSDKDCLNHRDLPERLMPQGLSLERQWYLYDHIRMHIPNEEDKENTCPRPKEAKPKVGKS